MIKEAKRFLDQPTSFRAVGRENLTRGEVLNPFAMRARCAAAAYEVRQIMRILGLRKRK